MKKRRESKSLPSENKRDKLKSQNDVKQISQSKFLTSLNNINQILSQKSQESSKVKLEGALEQESTIETQNSLEIWNQEALQFSLTRDDWNLLFAMIKIKADVRMMEFDELNNTTQHILQLYQTIAENLDLIRDDIMYNDELEHGHLIARFILQYFMGHFGNIVMDTMHTGFSYAQQIQNLKFEKKSEEASEEEVMEYMSTAISSRITEQMWNERMISRTATDIRLYPHFQTKPKLVTIIRNLFVGNNEQIIAKMFITINRLDQEITPELQDVIKTSPIGFNDDSIDLIDIDYSTAIKPLNLHEYFELKQSEYRQGTDEKSSIMEDHLYDIYLQPILSEEEKSLIPDNYTKLYFLQLRDTLDMLHLALKNNPRYVHEQQSTKSNFIKWASLPNNQEVIKSRALDNFYSTLFEQREIDTKKIKQFLFFIEDLITNYDQNYELLFDMGNHQIVENGILGLTKNSLEEIYLALIDELGSQSESTEFYSPIKNSPIVYTPYSAIEKAVEIPKEEKSHLLFGDNIDKKVLQYRSVQKILTRLESQLQIVQNYITNKQPNASIHQTFLHLLKHPNLDHSIVIPPHKVNTYFSDTTDGIKKGDIEIDLTSGARLVMREEEGYMKVIFLGYPDYHK